MRLSPASSLGRWRPYIIRTRPGPANLDQFGADGFEDVGHLHRGVFPLVFRRSAMGGRYGGIVDVAAGQDEVGQAVVVQMSHGRILREHRLPDRFAFGHAGEGKLDNVTGPSDEGRVQRLLHIGRQDRDAGEAVHPGQQIVDLDIEKMVVAVIGLELACC